MRILTLAAAFILAALTSAPYAEAQTSEYQARPGDVLVIEVLEDASLNRSVVILPDGRFSFPFAGTLQGAGRTVAQLQSGITSAISSNFATPPTVFVAVQPPERTPTPRRAAAPRTIDIYFLGEVNQPGLRPVAPGTTFLQAMAQSGGLTSFAATKRVQLRRTNSAGQTMFGVINYQALTEGAGIKNDPPLQDGDVIIVPTRRLFE